MTGVTLAQPVSWSHTPTEGCFMCRLAAVSQGAFAASAVLSSLLAASVPLLRCPSLGSQFSQAAVACVIFRYGRNSSFQAGLSWKQTFLLVGFFLQGEKNGIQTKEPLCQDRLNPYFLFFIFLPAPSLDCIQEFFILPRLKIWSPLCSHIMNSFNTLEQRSQGNKTKPSHVLSKLFIKYPVNKPGTLDWTSSFVVPESL